MSHKKPSNHTAKQTTYVRLRRGKETVAFHAHKGMTYVTLIHTYADGREQTGYETAICARATYKHLLENGFELVVRTDGEG